MEPGQVATKEIIITAIDNSDRAGRAADNMFGDWGEKIYFTRNAAELVKKVLDKLKGENAKLKELHIFDHGAKEWFVQGDARQMQLGTGYFGVKTFAKSRSKRLVKGKIENTPSVKAELAKLRDYFAPGGSLHLYHCWLGDNTVLLWMIAHAVGVPVTAGTGPTEGRFAGRNVGWYNTVTPSGKVSASWMRP